MNGGQLNPLDSSRPKIRRIETKSDCTVKIVLPVLCSRYNGTIWKEMQWLKRMQ